MSIERLLIRFIGAASSLNHVNLEAKVQLQSWKVVLSIIVVNLFVGVTVYASTAYQIQRQNRTLSDLIYSAIEKDIPLSFRFIVPPVDSERIWTVPSRTETPSGGRIIRVIYEVGNDYVCFETDLEGTAIVDCVPFSNIAFVGYDFNNGESP